MASTAEKKVSKAVIIRSLQQVVEEKQRDYEVLVSENQSLRTREEVLLQQVTQQGDNLHFVALAAAQIGSESDMPELAKTLIQDLEVYELLGMLGRGNSSSKSDEPEPFTTQRLRAAVTPERVAAMRSATVEEVAAHLKHLTMRMCMLLTGGPCKAHLFSDSIEAVVNEYGEYGLLMHVAADWISLQIGTMNLETLQVQEPPSGYWENVVDNLELQEQQVQSLAMGFNSYQKKSKPIISALHSSVSSIRTILEADETSDNMQGQIASSMTGVGQPFWQFLHNTLDGSGTNGANGAAAVPSNGANGAVAVPSNGANGAAAAPSDQDPPMQDQGSFSGRGPPGGLPGSSSEQVTVTKPWQQFGLSHGCLTAETAEQLEQHMNGLMQHVMKLREMHRTVTWLFLNTLNARQHALFITSSWPWWSRPLTMCQYIAEQHNQQHDKGRQNSGGHETSNRSSDGMPTPSGGFKPMAAAVADGVWHMTIGCTSVSRGPGVGAHLPAASHQASGKKGSVSGLP